MNSESNLKTQRTPSGKPTSSKRAHRANRPVLVTEQNGASVDEPTTQATEEAMQPEIPVAVETAEPVARNRRPGFFANIGMTGKSSDSPEADPKAVRMARAMRGKFVGEPKEKAAAQEKPPSGSSSRAGAAPKRPRSGFKTRYIWGMMAYLLIADFLGIWITNYMVAHGLDAQVFKLGTFAASRSTLIFLALLITILIVMARLDLIPSSFKAMSGGSSTPAKGTAASKKSDSTFETRTAQPTMKQGVKGQHDELYQEYRENQRYFQKRDRKR
jgi:hypothetical protein